MMECLIVLLILGGIGAAIYFYRRLQKLERAVQAELAATRGAMVALQARLADPDWIAANLPLEPSTEVATEVATVLGDVAGGVANTDPQSDAPEAVSPPAVGDVWETPPVEAARAVDASASMPSVSMPSASMPSVGPVSAPVPVSETRAGASVSTVSAQATSSLGASPQSAEPVAREQGPGWREVARENPVARWFMDSHMVVRAGILILFIGVAFLLRFAAEQGWFSVEMRLASAGLLGMGMVAGGWSLRNRRRGYALSLQGGGLGIAYMTVFAAFGLYELLPGLLAFSLLALLGVVCGTLAVLNDSRALAILAIVGGFAAPILAATEGGSHIGLFTYFAFLNVAILGIAWFKAWPSLNWVGFVLTAALASLWGMEYYQPADYGSVQPFVILFLLFYVAIGLLFARLQPAADAAKVDGLLVFGTPVVVAIWQGSLGIDFEYGLAWSAVGLGLFYFGLGALLFRAAQAGYAPLRESYLAIGSFFIVMAVPFAFATSTAAAIWAVSGVGLVWTGLRQCRRFHVLLGGLIQLGAGWFNILYWLGPGSDLGTGSAQSVPFLLNPLGVGSVLVALSGLMTGYLALVFARRGSGLLIKGDLWVVKVGATLWGLLWWYGIMAAELWRIAPEDAQDVTLLALLFVATGAVGALLGNRLNWWSLRLTGLLLWMPIVVLAAMQMITGSPLLAGWGLLTWPGAVVVHFVATVGLNQLPQTAKGWGFLRRLYQAGGLWLFAWLGTAELHIRILEWSPDGSVWLALAWAAMPIVLLYGVALGGRALSAQGAASGRWGFDYGVWLRMGLGPFVVYLLGWLLVINWVHSGDPAPLSYLTVLNPLALTQALLFGGLFLWWSRLAKEGARRWVVVWGRMASLALIVYAVSGELARFAHHHWDVPFAFGALLDSAQLQAAYSILWSVSAMVFMFWGAWKASRRLWLLGAALLTLTILKLFIVDLSGAETIARIVSFIGVGLLMLLIGYFAPIPPIVRGDGYGVESGPQSAEALSVEDEPSTKDIEDVLRTE